jgi:hypothetical protein
MQLEATAGGADATAGGADDNKTVTMEKWKKEVGVAVVSDDFLLESGRGVGCCSEPSGLPMKGPNPMQVEDAPPMQ